MPAMMVRFYAANEQTLLQSCSAVELIIFGLYCMSQYGHSVGITIENSSVFSLI